MSRLNCVKIANKPEHVWGKNMAMHSAKPNVAAHTPLISVQFFVVAVPVCMLPAEVCLALCMAAVQLVDSAGIQVTKSQLSSQQQTCKRRKRVETVSDKEWKRHQRLELILSAQNSGIPHTYMAGLWIVIELSMILI